MGMEWRYENYIRSQGIVFFFFFFGEFPLQFFCFFLKEGCSFSCLLSFSFFFCVSQLPAFSLALIQNGAFCFDLLHSCATPPKTPEVNCE